MLRCAVQEAGDYTLAQLVSTLSLRTGRLPLLCQPSAVAPLMELRSCHAWILAALVEAVEESRLNHLARCRIDIGGTEHPQHLRMQEAIILS